MIDNFDLIIKQLTPDRDDFFYHTQIIRRGKDHPELPAANRTIKTYFINGAESLQKRKQEIIDLCETFGARAYINLSMKSVSKMAKFALQNLAERIYIGDYKKVWKLFNTAAGSVSSVLPKWVIDIDDLKDYPEVKLWLEENKVIIHTEIPTKSGVHIITIPFRSDTFNEKFPEIDLHKNNPTVLYIP